MRLKENNVTFVKKDDDDINLVAKEVKIVEEEDMVDDEIDIDVVADGEVDDTVEVDMKVDNEGDVADDDKYFEEMEALKKMLITKIILFKAKVSLFKVKYTPE